MVYSQDIPGNIIVAMLRIEKRLELIEI